MKRSQLRQAVRAESVLISVLGAVLGGALALGGAWGIVQALDDEGITRLTIPTTQLAIILGLAAVAGVLAAAGPARKAARLNVLRAIATE
jgi:putative ABC transport system permease protein